MATTKKTTKKTATKKTTKKPVKKDVLTYSDKKVAWLAVTLIVVMLVYLALTYFA